MPVYDNINIDEYKTRFFDGDDAHVLLDVRTEEEFVQARIPGSINIPLDELAGRFDEVEDLAEGNPIVVVCRTGVRSIMGAQILRGSGMNEATLYNLTKGVVGWAGKRWPLEKG